MSGTLDATVKTGVAIYARVARKKYLNRLEKQLDRLKSYCKDMNYEIVLEVSDIASGGNEKRRGLRHLMDMAKNGKFSKLIIDSEERLARFGIEYLRVFFKSHGVEIEETGCENCLGLQKELAEDLIATVSLLTRRLCSLTNLIKSKKKR
jgi:putative resolvase